jgi:hypothetical protein
MTKTPRRGPAGPAATSTRLERAASTNPLDRVLAGMTERAKAAKKRASVKPTPRSAASAKGKAATASTPGTFAHLRPDPASPPAAAAPCKQTLVDTLMSARAKLGRGPAAGKAPAPAPTAAVAPPTGFAAKIAAAKRKLGRS